MKKSEIKKLISNADISKRKSFVDFRSENKFIENRIEYLEEVNGIKIINDSQSCDIDHTWFTIEKVNSPIIWIAGGLSKQNDYNQLTGIVKEKVSGIICFGADQFNIFKAFHRIVPVVINAENLHDAVSSALIIAKQGDSVLFSPACPAYDMFENYIERGKAFKAAVEKLKWGGI